MSDQVFDVVQYGATGDGIADDYPAIGAAYDALVAAGGGELWFPPGRRYRVRSTGVHGLHLVRQGNVTIRMGERAELVMDNMVDGLAVSHGIFVEGPAANIALIGVRVRYAALSAARQGWAPIYFLGANVGSGDGNARPYGWYRGSPDGTETWPQIEAGAVRNVRLENVAVENSPSVGIGIVGVDGIRLSNVTVRRTWADGLYHLYFRNARIDGFHGIEVGDDAISMASYESDLERADIDLPFHGEGSVVTNVVIEGRGPDRDLPCGSIVPLGVRDVTVAGFVIVDRFRGLRFEPGMQRTLDHPTLNLNFLACRSVVICDGSIHGSEQAISLVAKECNFGTPRKWWHHDVTIANLALRGGSAPFDCWATGVPQNGGPPLALFGGFHFRGIACTGFTSPHTTLAGLHDCSLVDIGIDSPLAIHGFVPYGIDPDLLDAGGAPMWPDDRCTFRSIRGAAITLQGLKRCLVEDLQSINAPGRGVALSTCADVELRGVRVLYPNRANDAHDNAGVLIDAFCKRITGSGIAVEQDGNALQAMTILAAADHRIGDLRVKTTQAIDRAPAALLSDRGWIDGRVSQVGRVEWHHAGSGRGWGVRRFPLPPTPEVRGDADAGLTVGAQGRHVRLADPLSANRTWTLHEDGAAIGDRIQVTREATSTGAFGVLFRGQREAAPGVAGALYEIVATAPGVPFDATFEFARDGWKLVSLVPARITYPNGMPLIDAAGRLHDQAGTAIADEFRNRTYANGAVLGYDSGMLAMGLSAPPSGSASFGVAGMQTYDANYLYVCVAANTWRRIALESF